MGEKESRQRIDLTHLINTDQHYKASIEVGSPESPEETAARLRREEAQQAHDRWKDRVIFLVAIAMLIAITGYCLLALGIKGFDPDAKKFASVSLPAVIGGAVGFLFGRNTVPK